MGDTEEYMQQLEIRNGEMSFLIGMIHVGIVELGNHKDMPPHLKLRIGALLDVINDKVEQLFYKDETNEVNKE